MSTERHHGATQEASGEPRNKDVAFEPVDVQVGTIYRYLVALGIAVGLALVACVYIFRFTAGLAQQSETPPTAAMQQMTEKMTPEERHAMNYPPEPRLQGVPGHQTDPQQDLRDKLGADNKANETLAWIDKNAGVAQIPVEDAMKIIAEKGLPAIAAAEKKK
jgi:hypothetical protein